MPLYTMPTFCVICSTLWIVWSSYKRDFCFFSVARTTPSLAASHQAQCRLMKTQLMVLNICDRDVKFVFSKFEFRQLKFGLNSSFIYIFLEKLKAICVWCLHCGMRWRSQHTPTRREAVYKQCNQPGHQAMLCSIAVNWCLLFVWATKICHFDSLHRYTTCARGAVQNGE